MSEQPPQGDPDQQPPQNPYQPAPQSSYQQAPYQQAPQSPYPQQGGPAGPGYGGQGYGGQGYGIVAPQTDVAGGLRSLFDFSFNTFATPKLVRIVYMIITLVIALAWVGYLIAMLAAGAWLGFFIVLIFGALVALVYLALARMTLEFYYSVVRMSEDIHERLR